MAEQLGRGLQNLVDRCDSGSRLANLLEVMGWQHLAARIPFGRCESMLPRGTHAALAATRFRAQAKFVRLLRGKSPLLPAAQVAVLKQIFSVWVGKRKAILSRGGGTGRRTGLKICWASAHEGSTPSSPTGFILSISGLQGSRREPHVYESAGGGRMRRVADPKRR